MSSSRQSQTTAVVTGAGRGFGSAIAAALIDQVHQVVGVARTADALADVHRRLGAAFVPLSGGYSGAKAMIRFLAGYAADESRRARLGIGFATVLPQLTPATELGAAGVAAYAQRQGIDTNTFAGALQPVLTPAIVGTEIARLCQDTDNQDEHRVYQLTGHGLHAMA